MASLPAVHRSTALSLYPWFMNHSDLILFDDGDGADSVSVDGYEDGIASSCADLSDGEHFILPSQDGIGEIVRVHCHGGWTILNAQLDADVLPSYFTSWQEYTDTVAGPSFDDFATWREWLVMADARTQFAIAPDCTQCATESWHEAGGAVEGVQSANNQVYHMTGNYYLCAWGTKGDCDMDLDEGCYSCVNRHGGNEYLEYMSGTWSVSTCTGWAIPDLMFIYFPFENMCTFTNPMNMSTYSVWLCFLQIKSLILLLFDVAAANWTALT